MTLLSLACFWGAGLLGAYANIEGISDLTPRKRIILWALTLLMLSAGTVLAFRQQAEQEKQYNTLLAQNQTLLTQISAEGSFPVVRPIVETRYRIFRSQDSPRTLPLEVFNAGSSPLSGLSISVVAPGNKTLFTESVSVVPPYSFWLLSNVIEPKFESLERIENGHRIVSYQIITAAQNGIYTEEIAFRNSGCNGWDFKLRVTKQEQLRYLSNRIFTEVAKEHQVFPPTGEPARWDGEARCMGQEWDQN